MTCPIPEHDAGKKNVLLTGLPGAGKTTAIMRLAEALRDCHPAGFYTRELREEGMRRGFELVGFDGTKALLAHTAVKSPYRVGRYGIDRESFENFLSSLRFGGSENRVVMIDEIGRMECSSEKFRNLVEDLLDSRKPVVATIALKGEGFISGVRKRADVRLFELTQNNRTTLPEELARYVRALLERR